MDEWSRIDVRSGSSSWGFPFRSFGRQPTPLHERPLSRIRACSAWTIARAVPERCVQYREIERMLSVVLSNLQPTPVLSGTARTGSVGCPKTTRPQRRHGTRSTTCVSSAEGRGNGIELRLRGDPNAQAVQSRRESSRRIKFRQEGVWRQSLHHVSSWLHGAPRNHADNAGTKRGLHLVTTVEECRSRYRLVASLPLAWNGARFPRKGRNILC